MKKVSGIVVAYGLMFGLSTAAVYAYSYAFSPKDKIAEVKKNQNTLSKTANPDDFKVFFQKMKEANDPKQQKTFHDLLKQGKNAQGFKRNQNDEERSAE